MIVLFIVASFFFVAIIIGFLVWLRTAKKRRSPSPAPVSPSPAPVSPSLAPVPSFHDSRPQNLQGFEPETAVFHCYENQNSGTLIRMKPDMEKFDQFVKIMNASKNQNFMNVGPVYFTDSLGRKRSGGYELRMKIHVYDHKTVPTLTVIPKDFLGEMYKINLFDYLSIMLYPIGNEDCEYDMSRHFGTGENRLQKNLLKFYVRHISPNSGYKRYYDDWSYWKQFFTIVDDVNYSSMFQVKDHTGTFVNFPSGNQDVFYNGIQVPADGTLEIRKTNVPASMKTMIFIVRTTYAGYGQKSIPFVHNSGPPGQYPTSLDSIVQLNL